MQALHRATKERDRSKADEWRGQGWGDHRGGAAGSQRRQAARVPPRARHVRWGDGVSWSGTADQEADGCRVELGCVLDDKRMAGGVESVADYAWLGVQCRRDAGPMARLEQPRWEREPDPPLDAMSDLR
jgi:hypothetical protein